MKTSLIILALVVVLANATRRNDLFNVEDHVSKMITNVDNWIEYVTKEAANNDPTVPHLVEHLGEIVSDGIDAVNDEHQNNINGLDNLITNEIGLSPDPTSNRVKCLRLQGDKLPQARKDANDNATKLKVKPNDQSQQLSLEVQKLIESVHPDSQVKFVVDLCYGLYPGLNQNADVINCLNNFGSDLTVEEKVLARQIVDNGYKFQKEAHDIGIQAGVTMVSFDNANNKKYSQLLSNTIVCLNMNPMIKKLLSTY